MEVKLLLGVLLSILVVGIHGGCNKLETCNREYKLGVESVMANSSEFNLTMCTELKAFSACLNKSPKSCWGDLGYHSSTSLIELLMRRYQCSQYSMSDLLKRPVHKPKPRLCTYNAKTTYQHCGLFGDPHLKTFSRNYLTCRIIGAWPLVANKYLAVQVTNLPVVNSSTATAITKLTVIIKQSLNCASAKTYEATADSPLRPYFIDGTSSTGPDETVLLKASLHEKNEKIEIILRYIDTTLIIRRVGEYLAFSCKMPIEIVNSGDEDYDLCRKGCPTNEVLDIQMKNNLTADWDNAYSKCTGNRPLENEYGGDKVKNTLTDYYLDWCIFDVMTSGKIEFVSAAHSAQEDIIQLDPSSLQNRTKPLWLTEQKLGSKAGTIKITLPFIYSFALLLLNM